MRFGKTALSFLLTLCLLAGLTAGSLAAEETPEPITDPQQKYAEALQGLTLFQGTDAGFDLDKDLVREQAITLVVRLMGAEGEAVEKGYQYPFGDVPAWAAPYVGYAYANWITSGMSVTQFGTGQLTTEGQYVTFMLRVLGYRSGEDFEWTEAQAFAEEIGLLPAGWGSGETFKRGDAAELCWLTLQTKCKDSRDTLAETLMDAGLFDEKDFAFAETVAEIGLDAAEAEQNKPAEKPTRPSGGSYDDDDDDDDDGGWSGGGSSGGNDSSGGGADSGDSGSSGGDSGGSSGGDADSNETEDIPLF